MKRIAYSPSTTVLLPNVFGDGADGNVTISGTTTLTSDMQYNSLTIASGGVLVTGGYRIFVKETLLNLGTIRNNGNNASGSSAGTAAGYATVGALNRGGAGRTTAGAGAAGTLSGILWDDGVPFGGNGGTGGSGAGGSGAGGTDFLLNAATQLRNLNDFFEGGLCDGGTDGMPDGGSGGGGGGFDSAATGSSGGGGGGGGVVWISARQVNNASGVIEAKGGNGAAASGTGNLGGGGGGGGGVIMLNCLTVSQGTLDVSAGTGGAGNGTGAAGGNGIAGATLICKAI